MKEYGVNCNLTSYGTAVASCQVVEAERIPLQLLLLLLVAFYSREIP